MDPQRLANIFSQMYTDAADGTQVAMIHLFGIKYSEEIRTSGDSPANIARQGNIHVSHGTEINKGCNLTPYVEVKNSVRFPSR